MEATDLRNPYAAELVDMPAESTARLLAAKASDLTWYTRTIRNAIRGARRQGRTLYVGRTATGAYIDSDPTALPVIDYAATADGRVVRFDGGGNAYDGNTAARRVAEMAGAK